MATQSLVNSDATLAESIDARRAQGDHRFAPVRFRLIEALARRATAYRGRTRQMLDARVAELLAAYASDLDQAKRDTAGHASAAPQVGRGPLGELVEYLAHRASSPGLTDAAGDGYTELKAFRDFRSTWSRLHAIQRLSQSLANVPDQAGPLNSQHLVHRALTAMRDLSPGYLDRFMSYVDALSWLDQLQAEVSGGRGHPRHDAPKKTVRGAYKKPTDNQGHVAIATKATNKAPK